MTENEITFEYEGQTYRLNEWLLMVPVIYEGETEGERLAEPDRFLHFSEGASEGLKKGMKVLALDDLFKKYQPANETVSNGIMHLRTIIPKSLPVEMVPVFLHLELFEKIFEPKHLGVFTLEEIMDLSLEYACFIIDPGVISKPVFYRTGSALTRGKTKAEKRFESCRAMMSGTLVAKYKQSHDKQYSKEYVRRLVSIGFTEAEANNLFLFELMIHKSIRTDRLADSYYIFHNELSPDLKELSASDEWYVEHQLFTISELVKIWDEAEYIWQTGRESLKDEAARNRVYSLTRYGGANLLLSYLEMVSEKAHTDMELLSKYARAEQDLLFLYRWREPDVEHPYKPDEKELDETPVYITLHNYGNDKVKAIKYIREITDASLPEAKAIADHLPVKLQKRLPKYEADDYAEDMKDSDIALSIAPAEPDEQDSDLLFNIVVTSADNTKKVPADVIQKITGVSASEAEKRSERFSVNLDAALPMETARKYAEELKQYGTVDLIPSWKIEPETDHTRDEMVYLTVSSYGSGKLLGVKYLRLVLGLSLSEAVAIADHVPAKLERPMSRRQAEEFAETLKKAGFELEITPAENAD